MKNKKIFIAIGVVLCICLGLFLFKDKGYRGTSWNDSFELVQKKVEKDIGSYCNEINSYTEGNELQIDCENIDFSKEPFNLNIRNKGKLYIDIEKAKDSDEILYIRENYFLDFEEPYESIEDYEELKALFNKLKDDISEECGESVEYEEGDADDILVESFVYKFKKGYIRITFDYRAQIPHQQDVEVTYINPMFNKDDVLSYEYFNYND